jgi:hypothetical protein
MQGSRDLSWFNPPAYPKVPRIGQAHRARPLMPASAALGSRRLAGFRRHLSRGAWFFPSLSRTLSRFCARGYNQRWRFPLGLFRSAMVAMVQRLDARGFCFHPQLSVAIFLALIFEVFRDRFRCHSQSMAERATSKLSTLALCQWPATSGLGEVRCWQSSAATNRLIRMGSVSKQSEGMSNSVQFTRRRGY